jgi:hypothetical protein
MESGGNRRSSRISRSLSGETLCGFMTFLRIQEEAKGERTTSEPESDNVTWGARGGKRSFFAQRCLVRRGWAWLDLGL